MLVFQNNIAGAASRHDFCFFLFPFSHILPSSCSFPFLPSSQSLFFISSLPQIYPPSISPQKGARLSGTLSKHGIICYFKTRDILANQSSVRQLGRKKSKRGVTTTHTPAAKTPQENHPWHICKGPRSDPYSLPDLCKPSWVQSIDSVGHVLLVCLCPLVPPSLSPPPSTELLSSVKGLAAGLCSISCWVKSL